MNDDVYHNGAFMLAHRFPFYMGFHEREGEFETPQPAVPFQYGTPDVYDFCSPWARWPMPMRSTAGTTRHSIFVSDCDGCHKRNRQQKTQTEADDLGLIESVRIELALALACRKGAGQSTLHRAPPRTCSARGHRDARNVPLQLHLQWCESTFAAGTPPGAE
jgi:hypothetical protein